MFFELHRDLRGYPFLADDSPTYPAMYSTEDVVAAEKRIIARYFIGAASWWIAEFEPDENRMFGFAFLGHDESAAEWGYVNIEELENLAVKDPSGRTHLVHRDLEWIPRPAREAIPEQFHARWWFE